MTMIVAVKHQGEVYLGCDSLGSSGTDGRFRKDPKIFMAHGIGYGFTSSYRMGQILKHHTVEILDNVRESDTYAYVVD